MRLVDRYIFKETAIAALAAFVFLTGVIWITQSLRQVDLVTTQGQTLLVFLGLTSLSLPSLAVVIAPFALFIGVVYVLNRLNGDSELIVLAASGVSPWRLMRPFFALASATAAIVAVLSLWAMPSSFYAMNDLIMQIRADFLTHIVREGVFATLDEGFVFHYRERAPDGSLRGIFMEDRRDPQRVTTYLAQSGETSATTDQNFLILEKGMIQRQSLDDPDPATVTFERYAIDLEQFAPATAGKTLKPRERSTRALLTPPQDDPYVRENAGAFRAELGDRLVAPLYAIALAFLGFAAQHRPRTTRAGRGASLALATLAALLARGAGFWASALSQRHSEALLLVYAIPSFAILASLAEISGVFGAMREALRGPEPHATPIEGEAA